MRSTVSIEDCLRSWLDFGRVLSSTLTCEILPATQARLRTSLSGFWQDQAMLNGLLGWRDQLEL